MALGEAVRFIMQFRQDREMRHALNSCEQGKFRETIISLGFDFSDHEFGDAVRSILLKCRDDEAAAEINEIRAWYNVCGGAQ